MLRGPKQPSSPGRINDHARQAAALIQQRGSAGYGGSLTTKGFLPNGRKIPPANGAGRVKPFRVESVYKNHLLCKPVTIETNGSHTVPESEESIVRVAKPFELWVMGWDSNERSIASLPPEIDGYQYDYFPNGSDPDEVKNPWDKRTKTLLDAEEYGAAEVVFTDELIEPPYVPQHTIIFAAKASGGALFSVTEQADPEPRTYNVQWIDLSFRTFQPAFSKIKVCNSGQTGDWYALIRASDAFQEE